MFAYSKIVPDCHYAALVSPSMAVSGRFIFFSRDLVLLTVESRDIFLDFHTQVHRIIQRILFRKHGRIFHLNRLFVWLGIYQKNAYSAVEQQSFQLVHQLDFHFKANKNKNLVGSKKYLVSKRLDNYLWILYKFQRVNFRNSGEKRVHLPDNSMWSLFSTGFHHAYT